MHVTFKWFGFVCYPYVFVQPGNGRRPVDWCRNHVLYMEWEEEEVRVHGGKRGGSSRDHLVESKEWKRKGRREGD